MQTYTFTYQEQLEINQWGTERISARFINGQKYLTRSTNDIDNWLKQAISKKLKGQLSFYHQSTVTEDSGNLSRAVAQHKTYLSNIVNVTIKTSKEVYF